MLEGTVKNATSGGGMQKNRVDYLDGWRGIAILLVLLEHFFGIREVNVGRMGVDIFFVLSGMLMANILFVKKVSLATFYKRRISRIFPVFFIFISGVSAASYIFGLSSEHENYFFNITFLRAYYPETPDLWNTGIPIGHLWSLNVEEHCYVLLSLLVVLSYFFKRAYLVILPLGVSCIAILLVYKFHPSIAPPAYHLRTEVVASFLLISAGYFLIKERLESYIDPWMPVVSFLLAVVCYSPYEFMPGANWILAPFLLAFTVNHLDKTSQFIKSFLALPILRIMGVWSYSIYLWQQPFYYYGTKFGEAFSGAGFVFCLVAIFVGAVSFYLIENPIRRYLNVKW